MITCVSLLFLYGTWGSSADKAEITSPSALKDLLIELASCGGREDLKRTLVISDAFSHPYNDLMGQSKRNI